MNISKEFFEKQLKKNMEFILYPPENIALRLGREFYICRTSHAPALRFEMDCKDLADYCKMTGLSLTSTNN